MPAYELWEIGENRTVDAAVVADGWLLLVARRDGGGWAVPGGFVDPGEGDVAAMVRELREETGVDVSGVQPTLFARVKVDDPRNTAEKWITTRLGVFVLAARPVAVAADDAVDVRWVRSGPSADVDATLRAETGVGVYRPHPPLIDAVFSLIAA